jgi:hypothetical protein
MTSKIGRVCAPIAAATMLLLAAVAGFPQDSALAPTVIRGRPQGLWVTNLEFVSEFQGVQISRSGKPIRSFGFVFENGGDFSFPAGMAFDSAKNLWVSYSSGGVIEVTRAQMIALARGLAVKPKVELSGAESYGLAFDSSGDLWVGDVPLSHISEFTADQLKMSGDQTPAITITNPDSSGWSPGRLRFDKSGNLWVA